MPIKVLIPTPLRPYTGKQSAIEVNAQTVGDALNDLVARHPDLRKHLVSEDGKLRSFVNVYLNDEDIRYLTKETAPVKETDTITIVPSVAGGC
jgi:adenylyltransferase/sulfurtransferase